MTMKLPNGSMVTSVFISTDSSDKIVAFYKEKLGDHASIVQTGNGTMLSAGEKDKNSVMVTSQRPNPRRQLYVGPVLPAGSYHSRNLFFVTVRERLVLR